jgi:hypothetical protein
VTSLQRGPARRRPLGRRSAWTQELTFLLDGITAEDYLCWAYDPEPAVLGDTLLSVVTRAASSASRAVAELQWAGEPPTPRVAARAAGFLLTAEVVQVEATTWRMEV